MDKKELAGMFDHTLLKAPSKKEDITALCREAREIGAASVCVNPIHVAHAKSCLAGSGVKVCTVIGFPLGANTSAVKAFEAKDAAANGADELDMVIDLGSAKAGDWAAVEADIRAVVGAADGRTVKVIIETCYLTDDEKTKACEAASRAGANFVKTSTGFGTGGATPHDVELMRKSVPAEMKVKASGGIRTYDDAMANIKAGASRLGVSASLAILEGAK